MSGCICSAPPSWPSRAIIIPQAKQSFVQDQLKDFEGQEWEVMAVIPPVANFSKRLENLISYFLTLSTLLTSILAV